MVLLSEKIAQRNDQLKQRVKVLQDALKDGDDDETLKTENSGDEEEFDRYAKMEILDDLIANVQNSKSSAVRGYHITPK